MSESFDDELERIKARKLSEIMAKKYTGGEKKMSHSYVELNDQTFDSFVSTTDKLVVVDFWASWCGPCMIMAPIFEQLARKYEGKVLMAKVNVDENLEVPQRLGIYGIPTFVFFKNGREVGRLVGAVGASGLEAEIKKYL
ncbi:MAG: thioredoxin [Candidatus Methanomethyliales bacterium]|nr:thioredoxin [Candidatus Methanomethylicales archaeon]